MNIKSDKLQTYKNIVLNIMAFGVQFFVSFFISPTIVMSVGSTAYGFVGLANDFISYAAIITTVFNSVAARFISKEVYQKNFDAANSYFNSLIAANFAIASLFGVVGSILVPNIARVLVVPDELVFDVQITFALVFVSYIVTVLTLVFTTSTFITNRTDLAGIRNIISQFVRLATIVLIFTAFNIKIYWVAFAGLVSNIVLAVLNIGLTKRLTPELRIDLRKAEKKYVVILAMSGAWMAFTQISNLLIRGLDLIIANQFVGEYEMGLLSIARTMPNQITTIINTIAPIFTPVFIMLYSENKINALVSNVKDTIKSIGAILYVPIAAYIIYSYEFYSLWQKSLTPGEIQVITILSSVTVVQAFFNASTSTMAQLSLVTNKLKLPVFVSFGCGLLNVIVVLFLVNTTDLGVYAIVLSSSIIMILRYVIFNSFYAASVLGQSLLTFMRESVKTWLCLPVILGVMYLVKMMLPVDTWLDFFVSGGAAVVVGYLIILAMLGRRMVKNIFFKFRKG